MKRFVFVFLVAVLLLSAVGAGAETIRLQLNDTNTSEHPTGMADAYFAQLVKERTEGRIEIEVFTGGTLYGSEPEAIEALVIGDLAFARVAVHLQKPTAHVERSGRRDRTGHPGGHPGLRIRHDWPLFL